MKKEFTRMVKIKKETTIFTSTLPFFFQTLFIISPRCIYLFFIVKVSLKPSVSLSIYDYR